MGDIQRQAVSSSDIAVVGYDEASQTLEIQFHATGTYRYFSVPKNLYEELRRSPSPGKFFRQQVKGKFAWDKLPPAAK